MAQATPEVAGSREPVTDAEYIDVGQASYRKRKSSWLLEVPLERGAIYVDKGIAPTVTHNPVVVVVSTFP